MAKSVKKLSDSERYIPYEIVFLMLVTLPTKLLLQMMSVCSEWRKIISDRRFIIAHLDRVNDIDNNSLKRYMFNAQLMGCIGLEDPRPRYELTRPMKEFSSNVEILSSCSGLLLLGDDVKCYYLWNPSTRLLRQFNGPSLYRDELRNFALGYDSTTSAYKVVRILRFTGGMLEYNSKKEFKSPLYDINLYDVTTTHVYNCKTEIWDKIEDFPYVIFKNAQGVPMNGTPHWVMFRNHFGEDEVIDLVIVYFDLVEDKFKEIPKPDWLDHSSKFEFGVFKGQLCFIHYTKPKDEVWVMQNYGETWINLSSLVDITSVRLPGWCSYEPLYLFGSMAFKGALYVESLVSPFGGDDNRDIIG